MDKYLGVVQKQRRILQAFLRRKRVGKYKVIFEQSLGMRVRLKVEFLYVWVVKESLCQPNVVFG
jgi:hypothetical protein